jgi:hypothetical protein
VRSPFPLSFLLDWPSFLTVSLVTVVPISVASIIFSFFYDPFGLILIAMTILGARECLIESFEESYRARRDKLATKARQRKEERKRRQAEQRERRRSALEEGAKAQVEGDKETKRGKIEAIAAAGAVRRDTIVSAISHPPLSSGAEARSGRRKAVAPPSLAPHQRGGALAALVISADAATVPVLGSGVSSGLTTAAPASPISGSAPSWSSRLRDHLPALPFLSRRESDASTSSSDSQPTTTAIGTADDGGARVSRKDSVSTISSSIDDSFKTLKMQLAKEQKQEFQLKLGISIFLFFVFWLVSFLSFLPFLSYLLIPSLL